MEASLRPRHESGPFRSHIRQSPWEPSTAPATAGRGVMVDEPEFLPQPFPAREEKHLDYEHVIAHFAQ